MCWILNWIPFVPAGPIQLWVSIWILHPKNKGESVAYLILQDYLITFEKRFRNLRNYIFEKILLFSLKLAQKVSMFSKSRISLKSLPHLHAISRETDQILLNELLARRKLASKDDLADLDTQLKNYDQVAAEKGKILNNQ